MDMAEYMKAKADHEAAQGAKQQAALEDMAHAAATGLPELAVIEEEMAKRGVEDRVRGVIRSVHRRAMAAPSWDRLRPAHEIRRLIRTFATR